MLMKPVYAGYVGAPNWNVSLRKGHHEPLIDLSTYERIQAVLNGAVYGAARQDINKDFPLRGFVACDDCGQPMTSCWSKGRNKYYPYYLCDTLKCASKRKSVARAKIEDGAEAILRALQPSRDTVDIVRDIVTDLRELYVRNAQEARNSQEKRLSSIEKQIQGLLDRIVDASSDSVVKAYETRIEKLEREKLKIPEKGQKPEAVGGT